MAKRVVFVQGSYDILNAGHCMSLQELKEKFGHVVVGLNTDELMMSHKGRVIIPFKQREIILRSVRWVDDVIPCNSPSAIGYLKKLDADVFASVPEWLDRQKEAIDWITAKGGEFYPLTYFPEEGEILSSTMIRQRVIEGVK